MENIFLKKNEITLENFKNLKIYKFKHDSLESLKKECYGNFKDLDNTKCKIDLLDKNAEKYRRSAVKYLHEYELVKLICKKQVISRAYFKLYEIIYFDPIITLQDINCFFICEAPGGFIECISDIRRKKNLRNKFISISIHDIDIKYDRYLEETNLLYGDITDITVIKNTINTTRDKFKDGIDLITADGGFDVKIFNEQELITAKLILCEIYIALMTQKVGGTFIIKFFDMFTHNSIMYYIILSFFYDCVKIIKPKTSRNCNSERYLVCYNFHGQNEIILNNLKEMIINFKCEANECIIIYPDFDFTKLLNFEKKISTFNNLILYEQVKTINESIKMVYAKDNYFQNLILRIFIDKHKFDIKLNKIFYYKNILYSKIKKCIDFLKLYNINTNQMVYRF